MSNTLFKLRYGDSGHVQEYIDSKPDYTQTSVNHALYNRHTTKEQLNKIIDDVGEENFTPHKVIEISKHHNFDWDKHLNSSMFAGNEHRIHVDKLSHSHLDKLLEDPSNEQSGKMAARSPNLTDMHKEKLLNHKEWMVRGFYAQNPVAKEEHLKTLLDDDKFFVKNHARSALERLKEQHNE